MITGLPACGKIVLIKLLDGHPNVYVTHTHDKILAALYGFNEQQVKYFADKVTGDSTAYSNDDFSMPTMCYKSKDLQLRLSPFFIRRMLNNYTGYYIAEQWSHLGLIPDESSSVGYKTEKFNFNFFDYEKQWNNNLTALSQQISPEDFYDCFYDAYFKAWPDYPMVKSGNVNYAFVGPNDPVSSSRFVLEEGFHTKIIFVARNLEGQIISKSLRLFRRNKQNRKDVKLENYILSVLSGDLIERYRDIFTKMNELKNKYPDSIYFLNIDEFMHDYRQGMSNLADFLGIPKDEIIYRPTIAGQPVSKEYVKQMNDDGVEIKRPVKQLLMIRTRGFKYFKENNEKIDWRIVFPYLRLRLSRIVKIPILGRGFHYLYQLAKGVYKKLQLS